MAILGFSAPSTKQDVTGASRKADDSPQGIFQVTDSFVSDPAYRKKLLSNPNAALEAAGVHVGKAKISMKYQEINEGSGHDAGAGQLLILVEHGGANWTGDVTLVLTK